MKLKKNIAKSVDIKVDEQHRLTNIYIERDVVADLESIALCHHTCTICIGKIHRLSSFV